EAVLAQLVERAPARAVGGDRILREPLRVHEAVEVVARVDRLVELGDVERARRESAAARERERDGEGERLQDFAMHGGSPRKREPWFDCDYQITTRCSGARAIGCGGEHWNALANSGRLLTGPSTRNFAGACSFDCTCRRSASGRCCVRQLCANERKKRCSGEKPSFFSACGSAILNASQATCSPPRSAMFSPSVSLPLMCRSSIATYPFNWS